MAALSTASLTNILQNSIDNLLLAEQQVRDKDVEQQDEVFVLEKFWTDLTMISKKLSFECTKIGICFTKLPAPTAIETSSLVTGVEQAVLSLVSVFYRLSSDYGSVLHFNVQYAVVRAIQSARLLLKVIKDEGGEAVTDRYRHSTGIVWQGCDLIEKCPQDNKAAVLKELHGQNSLVSDAFTEISEALQGDGSGWNCPDDSEESMEEDEKWTEQDKALIGPSVNLIKAAKILYKRVLAALEKNGSCATLDKVKELDQLYEDCKLVSKIVDTLILELYPPLNISNMEEQSHQLANLLQTALKTCAQSHIAREAEQPHIEFIHKAIEHNLDSMKEKLSQR